MSETEPDDSTNISASAEGSAMDSVDGEASKELTAEEQMALYEKSLKEDDWGHQPC